MAGATNTQCSTHATNVYSLQAELRATNALLERDNEAFREEVESTLEVVEGVATRNFKQGQEVRMQRLRESAATPGTGQST